MVADGKHLPTDVWATVGVIVGASCPMAFDLPLLDSLVGLAVGAYISCVAIPVIYRAVQDLLDRALNEEDLVKGRALPQASRHPESRIYKLSTRVVRPLLLLHFNLPAQGRMLVTESHALCDVPEANLRQYIAPCQVDIHLEPVH